MSNKSLVQIVMALQSRVTAIEKRLAEPQRTPLIPADEGSKSFVRGELERLETVPSTRKMCPKCGVKPGYFFHVRTCTGQKEEQKDADTDRRRDQGTP